jgi:hypothetical protein
MLGKAAGVKSEGNINCRRMRFELMNRRRPQYISITILARG